MGNSLQFLPPHMTDVHSLLIELPYFSPEGELLRSNKLFKTIVCTFQHNLPLLTKVYIKPEPGPQSSISKHRKFIDSLFNICKPRTHPNVLISDYIETDKIGVLYRQYSEKTLRQTLPRQPHLNSTEKHWIVYQTLKSVQQLHSSGLAHGSITSENYLVTSWNWVFLCDIGCSFKPVYIREGDLTTFHIFFEQKNGACYLAPERFVGRDGDLPEGLVSCKMDVFSLGCVIAEVFADGAPLFTFSSLMSYRRGEINESQVLTHIKNQTITLLLEPMIRLNERERVNINECLGQWTEYLQTAFFNVNLHSALSEIVHNPTLCGPDSRINLAETVLKESLKSPTKKTELAVLVPLVTSNLRSTTTPSARLKAVDCLLTVAKEVDSEVIVYRIIPFLVSLVTTKDERSTIKVAGLKAIIFAMKMVKRIDLTACGILEDYVWPSVAALKNEENEWILMALGSLLPELAELAKSFLDLSREVRTQSNAQVCPYEQELRVYEKMVISLFKDILERDNKPNAQLTILNSLSDFVMHFNEKTVLDEIVSSVLHFFNKEEVFRCAMLNQLPRLAKLVKSKIFFQALNIEGNLECCSENVLFAVLKALVRLSYPISLETTQSVLYCLMHPNSWVRSEALHLAVACLAKYDQVENYCVFRPLVLPVLNLPASSVYTVSRACLELNIRSPFTRDELSVVPLNSSVSPEYFVLLQKIQSLCSIIKNRGSSLYKQDTSTVTWNPLLRRVPGSSSSEEDGHSSHIRSEVYKTYAHLDLVAGNQKQLRGTLAEHEEAVTHLAVSEVHQLLYSASNDSTLRRWEVKQLENLQPIRSQLIFKNSPREGRFSGLEFKNNMVYAACSNRVSLLDAELSEIACSVQLAHNVLKMSSSGNNLIVLVDDAGNIGLLDTRTNQMSEFYSFGLQFGTPSALCSGTDSFAVYMGTLLGNLSIFDLRYNVLAKTYLNTAEAPISSISSFAPDLSFYTSREVEPPRGPAVLAAVGSQSVAWDILSGSPLVSFLAEPRKSLDIPRLKENSAKRTSLTTPRFAVPKTYISKKSMLKYYSEYTAQSSSLFSNWLNSATRAKRVSCERALVKKVHCSANANCILSGGNDSKVRLWSLLKPSSSYVFGEGPHQYSASQTSKSLVLSEERTWTEASSISLISENSTRGVPHLDGILDLQTISSPETLLVLSASRDSSIKIWS